MAISALSSLCPGWISSVTCRRHRHSCVFFHDTLISELLTNLTSSVEFNVNNHDTRSEEKLALKLPHTNSELWKGAIQCAFNSHCTCIFITICDCSNLYVGVCDARLWTQHLVTSMYVICSQVSLAKKMLISLRLPE